MAARTPTFDWFLPLMALGLLGGTGSVGAPPMDENFYDASLDQPIRLDVGPSIIQDARQGWPPAATATRSAEPSPGLCRYAGPARNSRLPASLPAGEWRVRWKTALDDQISADLVLAEGGSVLVKGSSRWQLLTDQGRPVAVGQAGFSDVFLDPLHKEFHLLEPTGRLGVRRLSDGELMFNLSVRLGERFARPLIVRRGHAMMVVGIERTLASPERFIPEFSSVELLSLGDPPQTDEYRNLTSMRRTATLIRRSPVLLPALQGDTLVLATDNHVYFLDAGLTVHADLSGDFVPVAMSLDEAGRVYLIVRVGYDFLLWVLTREGGRVMSSAHLPRIERDAYAPPIIGNDHRVYILGDERIRAIGPDGQPVWERAVAQRPAGAAITADDQLLVTESGTVFAYNSRGEATRLYSVGREDLTTAPVLTGRGELLVASARQLYCLEPQKPADRR